MKNFPQERILNFLNHPNHDIIEFSRRQRCFRFKKKKNKKVKGLVPVLKRCFWKNYVYESSPYKNLSTGVANKYEGMARGSRVHEQLECYVNSDMNMKEVKRRFGRVDPYFNKARLAMREWKWTPLIAELPIYDPGLGIATKTDMIGVDDKGKLILVEWKCGMDNYGKRGNAPMLGPLKTKFSNCPINQALVQLLFTRLLLQNYGLYPEKSYVVQINSEGITPHALPKKMRDKQAKCYQYVANKQKK